MIEWLAGSAFFLGVCGMAYAFYRTGYLRGWADCVKEARQRHQVRQMRKTVDLEAERLRRRKW